ncbi:hypothetical protein [Maribacter forsetii]|uniref:hypothetical protein n=1 Tax=Maribacter forsetii TaxID=444515 RepID=UPI00055E9844|nr:hypothetical protein [Maribacter forsetii]
MKKYISVCIVVLCSMLGYAHNPDISTTMLVEKGDGTWILQISSSLTAFQQEVRTHFTETPYNSPEEFQQMVLEHIKNNLEISYNNGSKINFGQGIVKLGHETKVVFEVFGIPSNLQSLQVTNTTFKDIGRSQSALFLFKDGFQKDQFVLNNENGHTQELIASGNKFIEPNEQNASFNSTFAIIIVISLLVFSFIVQKTILSKVPIE